MRMFEAFYDGHLDIFSINFALITLIPKEEGASMKKFRPITLLNCSNNFFPKVLTNRINLVADRLICSNQTTFIRGRYILESVIMTHEIIHSVHQRVEHGVVLKLDYEKAYDKVNWEFLLDVLKKKRVWLKMVRLDGENSSQWLCRGYCE